MNRFKIPIAVAAVALLTRATPASAEKIFPRELHLPSSEVRPIEMTKLGLAPISMSILPVDADLTRAAALGGIPGTALPAALAANLIIAAAPLRQQGALIAIRSGSDVLLVPQTLEAGARAALFSDQPGDVKLFPYALIAGDMQRALTRGDAGLARQILTGAYDGVRERGTVSTPAASPSEAARATSEAEDFRRPIWMGILRARQLWKSKALAGHSAVPPSTDKAPGKKKLKRDSFNPLWLLFWPFALILLTSPVWFALFLASSTAHR